MVKLTDGATALDWIVGFALDHLLLIFFKLTLGWSTGVNSVVCLVGGIDRLLLSFYKHFISFTDFQIALCPDSLGMAFTQSCWLYCSMARSYLPRAWYAVPRQLIVLAVSGWLLPSAAVFASRCFSSISLAEGKRPIPIFIFAV